MDDTAANASSLPPPLTLGQVGALSTPVGAESSTAENRSDSTTPPPSNKLESLNKRIELIANGQSQFQQQMMLWFQTNQMATAVASANAAARLVPKKLAEEEKSLPFLNLRLKEVDEIDYWKCDSSSNKHRYAAMLNVAKRLNKFQEKFLPQDAQDPEKAEAWNEAMVAVRGELENILIAEKSEFGWLTVKELSSDPVTRDEAKLKQIKAVELSLAKKKKTDNKASVGAQGVKRPHPDPNVVGPIVHPSVPPQYAMGFMGPSYGQFLQPYGMPSFEPQFYGGFGMQPRFLTGGKPGIRSCYDCGKPGHLSYACPEKK